MKHLDGTPLTKYQSWVVTAKALEALGLKGVKFGTQSFRIGAASTMAVIGYSVAKIQEIGGWRLGVNRRYVLSVQLQSQVWSHLFLVNMWDCVFFLQLSQSRTGIRY